VNLFAIHSQKLRHKQSYSYQVIANTRIHINIIIFNSKLIND